jgi:hypothetical protein
MPAGGNHGRLKFSPAIPWDGVGIEDRDGHESRLSHFGYPFFDGRRHCDTMRHDSVIFTA